MKTTHDSISCLDWTISIGHAEHDKLTQDKQDISCTVLSNSVVEVIS